MAQPVTLTTEKSLFRSREPGVEERATEECGKRHSTRGRKPAARSRKKAPFSGEGNTFSIVVPLKGFKICLKRDSLCKEVKDRLKTNRQLKLVYQGMSTTCTVPQMLLQLKAGLQNQQKGNLSPQSVWVKIRRTSSTFSSVFL
ncbi:uncharacterized protein C11orf97 homolog isoform X2 [Rhinatrema bivittatum]|uniref:uncharacterized protein C11orf97 homolog isoform X2 n=1 Tax=Rhinatrema bivittatum TaxID=194408 RepID=UPI00112D9464|nr:uncharacterized protein C11orf97 homolog isoform X2 [Rhinatrema bivittatum]